MRVSFIIYADFEASNIPVECCAGNPQKSYSTSSKADPVQYTAMWWSVATVWPKLPFYTADRIPWNTF